MKLKIWIGNFHKINSIKKYNFIIKITPCFQLEIKSEPKAKVIQNSDTIKVNKLQFKEINKYIISELNNNNISTASN